MYQLSCPACKHTVELSFARVGAQAVCRSCAHRFTVNRESVKRLVAVPDDSGSDTDNPLLLGHAASKPPPPARPQPVERNGEPTPPPQQQQPGAAPPAQADPDLKPIQPIVTHQEPSPDVARLIARHRARRQRRQRTMIAVISGLLLVTIAVGYMLFNRLGDSPAGGAMPGNTEKEAKDLNELAIEGPVVQSSRLPAMFWDEIDRSTDIDAEPVPVKVTNARLADGSDGRVVFRAEIETGGFRVIEQATLHVFLVNENNRVFAAYDLPLMLLSPGGKARSISITVPTVLVRRTDRWLTYVTVEKEIPGGIPFENVVYEPIGGGNYAAVRITAYNPIASTMTSAMFHIRAFNAGGETVARWIVNWKQPIEGRQRVEFAAMTPVKPEWKIATWEVIGAGVAASGDAARNRDSDNDTR